MLFDDSADEQPLVAAAQQGLQRRNLLDGKRPRSQALPSDMTDLPEARTLRRTA
ncbi:MAG: hypothetical protein ACLT98_15980 [Eggerthellaceae bacterium]